MGRIHILDETTANQIAAGEVVERPSSVLKELIENAIDAGSSRIAVTLSHGGKTRLEVADDGHGLLREDVERAFERHATSKLTLASELTHVRTLGFRGEALPSIASVARVSLTTLASGEVEGTRIEIHGGKRVSFGPAAAAPGTVIEVSDLFFNVPARLKFLKSTGAETAAASATFLRQALAHPEIHFRFASAGREDWVLAKCSSMRDRASQLLGSERIRNWIDVKRDGAGVHLVALIEAPQNHHPTRGEQYLYVNGRPVTDAKLQYALLRGYEGLLPPGRFPAVVLFLTLDPGLVDVNVHPAKSEVRFSDAAAIQALVAQGLRDALSQGGYVPTLRAAPRLESGEGPRPPSDGGRVGAIRDAAESYLANAASRGTRPGREYRIRSGNPGPETTSGTGVAQRRLWTPDGVGADSSPAALTRPAVADGALRVLGQFRDTFVVACDDEGLLLVDQHTAHERVLFERLEDGDGGAGRAQRLLLPQMVELTAGEARALEGCWEDLSAAGIEVEPMGGQSYSVRTLPPGMSPASAALLMRACAAAIHEDGAGSAVAAQRRRVLATVACHAAVKRNMVLEMKAMERLVADVRECRDPYRCPHGRAVILRFTNDAIQKSFGRYW